MGGSLESFYRQHVGLGLETAKALLLPPRGSEGVQTQFRHFPQPVADQLRN